MIDELLTHFGTFYFICEWLIRLIMLVLVPLRRTPEATRSWLLLIFFLPVPGLLLYLAIGRPRFPEWRKERFDKLAPLFFRLVEQLKSAGTPRTEPLPALAAELGGMPAVEGNRIAFIDDYDGMIDGLVRDIDAARHHVRVLVYIFADDATGRKVVDALARATARGVACHVLVDPIGSHIWIRTILDRLRDAKVEVREALPFRLWRNRTRRDMRNHRKIFLIDGEVGYVGSQNIVDKDFRTGVTNHELVVRVTGPAVAEMTAIFLADWYLETEVLLAETIEVPPPAGDCVVQLLPSGATYPLEGFQTLLIWQVHAARERMMITSPYFIPDEGLLGALRTAVLRGVEIDLIVSAVVDQPFVTLAQRSYYDDLLAAGVRIHLFRRYLLHAKNVSVDGNLAIVGSSNIDIRSFELNEEVSLLLYDRASVEALERIQLAYIENSDPLDLAVWRRRPGIWKLGENVARLVGPLL